jgi:hypothetical protein
LNEWVFSSLRWGGGVEMFENYRQLYGHLIRDIVIREDPLRPYLPSSPTNGILTVEENFLSLNLTPWSELYGDSTNITISSWWNTKSHFILGHYYLNGDASVLDSRAYTVARFVSEFGFQSMPFLRVWKKETVELDLVGGFESQFVRNRQHSMGGNDKVYDQTAQLFIHPDREQEFKTSKFSEFIFLSQVCNNAFSIRCSCL